MGWRGPTEMRRKRELSAGECRGRPRHRGAAGKGANPLPLHGSLAHGDTAWARGWPARLAQGCLPPRPWGQGPLCTARMAWGQRLRPSPSSSIHPATSSFPGAQARGCIPASPPPPGWAACISSLALARASTGMGRRGQLASFPWDTRQQARCHGSGWKDFPAARSRGSVPAHSVPAPVSCHNRGCSRRCLVCGLVPVQTVSLGTGLAVCPA